MILSLIVPFISSDRGIKYLLRSLRSVQSPDIEVIAVNQTKTPLDDPIKSGLNITEHMTDSIIPASSSRNLGASLAKGKYLFFLDDDAFFFDGAACVKQLLEVLRKEELEMVVAQRGWVRDGVYISHWPKKQKKISCANFSRFIIEWNIVIKKDIFEKAGGFPKIGNGQPHAAQSGEAFVLAAKIFSCRAKIRLLPEIRIAHPQLNPQKSLAKTLGYMYGNGYAIGISMKYFTVKWKMYWIMRGLTAPIKDVFSGKQISLCFAKITGLKDGVLGKKPKDLAWLNKMVKDIE